ncbi:ARM repeat-containing protein [Dichomitus squalens]|uniref:ARM repeat-containing protein n=1 Tax=Dichomitus squalens TaxID=114155 RepID=A0A4V2K9X6_9APHY|nr:ARM repeat-containing protein [Dichomitus squalens]
MPSREIIEQITPGEAVEYVLPLLNGLAMDEDEAVKEALAAELVPIIWWFITHCRLVEDDPPAPPSPPAPTPLSSVAPSADESISILPHLLTPRPESNTGAQDVPASSGDGSILVHEHEHDYDAPTVVPVQAFTPILGTLLLSPNGIVGGSARYAVVELLRRLRRADEREQPSEAESETAESLHPQQPSRPVSPALSQASYQDSAESLDLGLFQENERRLFERELVYQVVIGMGRLDMDDHRNDHEQEDFPDTPSEWDASTAVPTPQAIAFTSEPESYFPPAPALGMSFAGSSALPAPSPLVSTVDTTAVGTTTLSPAPSPSPPVLSTSPMEESPGHSSASTPSLTSSTSSSSGDYSDTVEPSEPDRFSLGLTSMLSASDDGSGGDELASTPSGPKMPFAMTQEAHWTTPGALPRPAALPTTPPFEVPPPPPVASPVPVSAESTMPLSSIPTLMVQAPSASPLRESPPRQQILSSGWLSPGSAARELAALEEQQHMDEGADLSEEAAVGRLSSMSLMAAVTASGSIGEDTKRAFVAEVERVGRDSVYWVRREASFAVGALAKVVPVEVVTSSLLPLFESLCHDATWHVRHSVLFALPAILSRLTPERRRTLALEVIVPLSQDEEATVRSAVLEALGEVIYTFADDEDGPPEALLNLFLGARTTDDPPGSVPLPDVERDVTPREVQATPLRSATSTSATSSAWSDYGTDAGGGPDIYDDPQRPLICAFNYPAVALTLGQRRWPELRSLYLSLAKDPSLKIRKTLAASLGEIAKIIGEEHAAADLMSVFWSSLHAAEGEVRTKIVEALPAFVRALAHPQRVEVVRGLEEAFSSGKLSSWRERERAVKALDGVVEVEGVDSGVLQTMLVKALDDRVAAVREAAVSVLPVFLRAWKHSPTLVEALVADIRAFAGSDSFRRRMTYVTCVQEMVVSDHGDVTVRGETFWETLSALVRDPIVDVRIRVARLLGLISDKLGGGDSDVAAKTVALARDLAQDSSHEVQAFATAVLAGSPASQSEPSRQPVATVSPPVGRSAATFSRPPPPSPS